MTVELFLMLLLGFSTFTSLLTEAIKKIVKNKNIPVDMIVLCVSLAVGGVGTLIFYILNGLELNTINFIYCGLMAVATWLSSMLGYDKIIEAIAQINGVK